MEISGADYQIMNNHTLEDVLGTQQQQQQQQEKKPRPQQETALKCPRCESTNTKFCYYNNYSLSQPRYFCKGCRRYWTKGGSLRNVPVGGGCRKNKKSSNSSSKRTQDLPPLNTLPPPPPPFSSFDPNDLTLAFARLHNKPTLDDHVHDSFLLGNNPNPNPNPSSSLSPSYMTTTPYTTNTALLDALRNGFLETTSTPNGLRSTLYYGFGGHNNGECLGGAVGLEGGLNLLGTSVATTTATITTTTASQDSCEAIDAGESKALLGLQWQFGGLDAGRDCWINGVGSSWHDGLINTSLL